MAETSSSPNPKSNEMVQRFIQFVMVQAQNVLLILGKIPTPEGTLLPPNLQAGKMLIDQLEMIRVKTEGNRTQQETKILDEIISNIQLAFVEASGGTPASMMPDTMGTMDPEAMEEHLDQFGSESAVPDTPPSPEPPAPAQQQKEVVEKSETSAQEEDKKKYFKSYG